MDHDLLMMLYGAMIGVGSRVITSMLTSTFQLWLNHREQARQQDEEHEKVNIHIYLPTAEEVRAITEHRYQEPTAIAPQRGISTGTAVLSIMGGGFLIHQADQPLLSLAFAAVVSYFITNKVLKRLSA